VKNKLFIIQKWNPEVGNECGSISFVPVWVKFSNIPIYAWSHLGINWLASRFRNLLCMDEYIEKLDRITYAKCLIDIKPDKELVGSFPFQLLDGKEQMIHVNYLWKPDICVGCKSFGHKIMECMCSSKDSSKDEGRQKQEYVKHQARKEENRHEVQPNEVKRKMWKHANSRKGVNSQGGLGKGTEVKSATNAGVRQQTWNGEELGNKEVIGV